MRPGAHHPLFGRAAVTPALLAVAVLLAGCVGGLQPPAMLGIGRGQAPSDPAASHRLAPAGSTASALIAELSARPSVLPAGGPYARVADAVVSASSGVEAAELGLARLRAEAASRNGWPSVAPVLTLDSLAGLAAQLVIDQPVLDHGRRKAERARAAAEVDLAAVSLASRQNQRVFEGLSHYLTAEQARAQAAIVERAAARLTGYQDIVDARVQGGLSDQSEAQIIAQTRAEMQATLAADRQVAAQAMADLAALARHTPPADLRGLDPISNAAVTPLSVLIAQATGARTLAEAQIARANALPGLSATGTIQQDGTVTPGLRLGGVRLGLGTPSALAAADAAPDLVARQKAEADQTATRRDTALQGEIAALQSRQSEGATVLARTLSNLDLYAEQYSLGRRSLTDLVGQYAAAARLERDQAALAYAIARLQLERARDMGTLIAGSQL